MADWHILPSLCYFSYVQLHFSAVILSLSSKVAVNKSKREDQIESTLESLRWELPRVGKLQGLIPGDDSALLVSKVYSNVVKFARSCVLYYSRNSLSMCTILTHVPMLVPPYSYKLERVLSNIIRPPKLYIDKEVEGIHSDVAEIIKEVEVNSHQRIRLLEARQQGMQPHRSRTLLILSEETRDFQVKERMWDLQKALRSKAQTAEDLVRYRNALLDPSTRSKKYEQFNLQALQEKDEFQAWYTSEVSGLFLLYGTTLNARSGFSWLSSAALDFVQALRDGTLKTHDNKMVLCAVAHDTAWSTPQVKTESNVIISQIVLSALEQQTSYISDATKFSRLKASIEDPDYKHAVPRLPCRVLSEIIECDPALVTYVVLDRIDACNCGTSTFLETLLEVVLKCKSTVKVFAVVGGLGNFDVHDILATGKGDKFHPVRIDQRVSKTGAK